MSQASTEATTSPTPIPISPRTRAIILVVLVIASVLLLRAMPSVGSIFLGGATLALLLSFPVRLLTRFMRRGLAILTTVLGATLLVIAVVLWVVPLLVQQLVDLIAALQNYASDIEGALANLLQPLRDRGILPDEPSRLATSMRNGLLDHTEATLEGALAGIVDLFSGTIGGIVHAFIACMISIYLLIDGGRFKASAVRLAPARYQPDADTLFTTLGGALSRYLGGLAFSMAEQGTLIFLGSWLLGIPHAVVLGVWFGLTAVIPYLGAWLGAIPLVLVALLSGGLVKGLLALCLTFLVNGFDSNIVQPNVQGKALQVHPIIIMLGVIGGSELIGPLGAVFALPVIGMTKVLIDFFTARLVVRQPARPVVITIPGRPDDSATLDGDQDHFPATVAASEQQ